MPDNSHSLHEMHNSWLPSCRQPGLLLFSGAYGTLLSSRQAQSALYLVQPHCESPPISAFFTVNPSSPWPEPLDLATVDCNY